MGTYYDIVCPEHKEVLRLWKADELWGELEHLVEIGKLKKQKANATEPNYSHYSEFIVLTSVVFRFVIKQRPKAKQWLEKHKTCKLFFLDSEYNDVFNFYSGFTEIDGQ